MKIGPKFKIAKRLGAPIFEKTQSQKFALSEARQGRVRKRGGTASDYKKQLIEKQKMRFTFGITEKQLSRYVADATGSGHQPIARLMDRLERRLDNVVYRLGLAKTRRLARQMVSHGHIYVNGRRLNVPSHRITDGDVITVREGSKSSILFTEKQLSRYVADATGSGHQPIARLMDRLERRLDNVVYRLGLAKTRRLARQMVSHGHIYVNGRRLNVPSHRITDGDVITVREGSKSSVLFTELAEKHDAVSVPAWLKFDAKALSGTVVGAPMITLSEYLFDPEQVLEYYSR